MYLSRQQIFPAQLSKSMTCRTDYRTQTPVKLHRRVSISHGMILMIEQNTGGGGWGENTPESSSASPTIGLDQSQLYSSLYDGMPI